MSSDDEEPIPSPTTEFAQYQALLQKTIIGSAKLAASLPPKSDLSFQRTLDRQFGKDLDGCATKILALTNKLLDFVQQSTASSSKAKGKGRMLNDDEDVVDRYHSLVVDPLEVLFENVDACLDEYSGKKTLAVPLEQAAPKAKPDVTKRLDQKLLNSTTTAKPQLKFPRPPDNFTDPWKHTLNVKHHAIQPLNSHDPHPYRHEIENVQHPDQVEPVTPRPVQPFESTPFTWVDTPAKLADLMTKLKTEREIAVDLEHHDYRSYAGFVCLMQISTRHEDFVVDTLALRDELVALNEVFTDPAIVKVFHGAESDIKWLQQDFNLYIVNLFDTYHAAFELDSPKKSLAFLLLKYCDFAADKRYQLADWRIRPLPEEMLFYARSDTHFLLFVYDNLQNELLERSGGRSDTLQTVWSKSATTALNLYQKETVNQESAWALARKWNKGLYGKQQAIFEAVYMWRDRVAREEDESPRYVLPNHFLFTLAEKAPPDVPRLLSSVQPTPPLLRRRANELLQVIQKAISQAAAKETEKVAKRKAAAAFGAMDIDSGPFANVTLPSGDDDEPPVSLAGPSTAALFDPSAARALSAPTSILLGDAKFEPATIVTRYQEIVQKIHSSMVLTPSVPDILKAAGVTQVVADAKPNLEKPIPVEPEQIPFVPASQRQATATQLKFKQTTKYSALEDSEDDDEIVEVKDPSRKKQRKAKAKAEFVETSLLAAASGSSTPAGTQDDDADMITLDKEGDGVDGKKKRKRKKNSAGAETPTEPAVPYDYSTAPNLLDEGLDEFEKGKSGKKRKTEKQRGSGKGKKPSGLVSGFGAPPRAQTEPKSGNKSMTFRS